jgi:hypothetical protein
MVRTEAFLASQKNHSAFSLSLSCLLSKCDLIGGQPTESNDHPLLRTEFGHKDDRLAVSNLNLSKNLTIRANHQLHHHLQISFKIQCL